MCPKYTQLRSSMHDLPEIRKVKDSNKELFRELTNFTGIPIATIEDVGSLYSTLTAEVTFIQLDLQNNRHLIFFKS